jgi:hypothetical protein
MQDMAGDPGRRHRGFFGKLRRGISIRNVRALARRAAPFAQFIPGGQLLDLMGDPRKKVKHAAHRGKHHILKKIGKLGGKALRHAKHLETALGLPEIDLSGVVRGVAEKAGIGGLLPEHEEAIAAGVHPAALGLHRRRRSMHVTNVKALRRSMRRVQGFAKLARKVMTFTSTHRMKRRRRK